MPTVLLLKDIFGFYMEYQETQDYHAFEVFLIRKGLRKKTIKNIHIFVKNLLIGCPELNKKTFDEFIVKKIQEGRSHSCINKYIQSLRHYCEFKKLKWAAKIKQLPEHVAKQKTFSDDEIESFLKLAAPEEKKGKYLDYFNRWTVFWSVCAYTGCRMGEALGLKTDDVDLQLKIMTFRQTKTDDDRSVPISSNLLPTLTEYLQKVEGAILFPSDEGPNCVMSDGAYRKDFDSRCERLGIKGKRPYSFRHSFVTRMLQDAEAPMFAVQDIVGHKKAETTRRYYHGNLKAMHQAIKKDPLVKKNSDPKEIVQSIVESIEKLELHKDSRFDYSKIQEALALLWKSVKE